MESYEWLREEGKLRDAEKVVTARSHSRLGWGQWIASPFTGRLEEVVRMGDVSGIMSFANHATTICRPSKRAGASYRLISIGETWRRNR